MITQVSDLSAFFNSRVAKERVFSCLYAVIFSVFKLLFDVTGTSSTLFKKLTISLSSLSLELINLFEGFLRRLGLLFGLSKNVSCMANLRVNFLVSPRNSKKFPGVVTQNFGPFFRTFICGSVSSCEERLMIFGGF